MLIVLALALTAATAAPSGPAVQPRKEFGACLKKVSEERGKDKLDAAAFTAAAKAACANEETAFRKSVVDFDVAMKVKRAEAEENASMQVEDYLTNAADGYTANNGGSPQ